MQRRDVLIAAGTGALASLSGCQTAVGAVALPDVPEEQLEAGGWKQRSVNRGRTVLNRNFGPVSVKAVASSVVYTDVELSRTVAERTLGMVDATLAMFFATRIDMAPAIDELGPIQEKVERLIMDTAGQKLRTRLQGVGLEDVTKTGTGTLTVDTGQEARLRTYRANYPVPDFTFPVTDGTTVTIPGTDLAIEALLAVWASDAGYLVAGGAYPAENYSKSISRDLSSAITVSVDIDLGLRPSAYRTEVRDLMTAVE
ncbi:MAG: hypothetical protein ABEJ71_00635 [Halodesulfurarchaeum sp.]